MSQSLWARIRSLKAAARIHTLLHVCSSILTMVATLDEEQADARIRTSRYSTPAPYTSWTGATSTSGSQYGRNTDEGRAVMQSTMLSTADPRVLTSERATFIERHSFPHRRKAIGNFGGEHNRSETNSTGGSLRLGYALQALPNPANRQSNSVLCQEPWKPAQVVSCV